MKNFILLGVILLGMTPALTWADEEEKAALPINRTGVGIPEAVEEDEDYPIITDEDYPYLDDDFEPGEQQAPSAPQN